MKAGAFIQQTMRWNAIMAVVMLMLLAVATMCGAPRRVVLPTDARLWNGSLQRLVDEIGTVEATGRNDGERVEAYLRSTGLGKGNPWCQAVQYWAFHMEADALGLDRTAIPITRTASTQRAFEDAVKNGTPTDPIPQDGDLVTWWYAGKYKGHVERIVRVVGGGWLALVGGNTSAPSSSGSQRDGDGVWPRMRNWLHPLGRMVTRGFIGAEFTQPEHCHGS